MKVSPGKSSGVPDHPSAQNAGSELRSSSSDQRGWCPGVTAGRWRPHRLQQARFLRRLLLFLVAVPASCRRRNDFDAKSAA
jgi:hypothetical protein